MIQLVIFSVIITCNLGVMKFSTQANQSLSTLVARLAKHLFNEVLGGAVHDKILANVHVDEPSGAEAR